MTPRQTNLIPRLTPSLLTDHMTPDGFPKRPLSMKGQRWKHIVVEEKGRKKNVCSFFRKWRLFIGEGGLKNVWEAIITVKKRVKTRFSTLPPSKNVWKTFCLWCRPPTKTSDWWWAGSNQPSTVHPPKLHFIEKLYHRPPSKNSGVFHLFTTMSPSPGWMMSWIKSTVNSTTETRGGWSVLTVDVHCLTQPDLFLSAVWNWQTMTTWEPCSLSLLSIVLEDRLSWTLRWLDLLNKFWKSLYRPRNYEEIRALLEGPKEEKVSLDDPW